MAIIELYTRPENEINGATRLRIENPNELEKAALFAAVNAMYGIHIEVTDKALEFYPRPSACLALDASGLEWSPAASRFALGQLCTFLRAVGISDLGSSMNRPVP